MKETGIPSTNEQSNEQSRSLLGAAAAHWEVWAYALLILVAAAMRFWDLGNRAIGYDESLHAYYSFRFAEGLGFQHSALTHGPFQFHAIAAVFFLFGDSDYTSRLPAAIFGTALVGLPFFLRDRLGRAGALATAALLAFSPMLLFYSRYARNDIFMAVWTLGLAILLWRYIDEGKPRYLYLAALTLALAFATKETTFFVVGIWGSYLMIVAAADWIPWLLRQSVVSHNAAAEQGGEYGYTPGRGYGYWGSRAPARLSAFSRPGVFLVLLATLVIPQTSALISQFQGAMKSYGVVLASASPPVGAPAGDTLFTLQDVDITKGMVIAAIVVFLAVWFSTLAGISWSRGVWLRCAAIFYSVWLLLFTTFFTNVVGLGSGMWQSLGYWIVQQDVSRGDQPWYYYFLLAPIYETLPLVFSLAGVVYYAFRGNGFTRFLAYWVVMTFILYTWAGEKMPWLLVNITLPMIVLSGKLIGDMIAATPWRRVRQAGGLYLFPITALLLYLLARLFLFNIQPSQLFNLLEFGTLIVIALALLWVGRNSCPAVGRGQRPEDSGAVVRHRSSAICRQDRLAGQLYQRRRAYRDAGLRPNLRRRACDRGRHQGSGQGHRRGRPDAPYGGQGRILGPGVVHTGLRERRLRRSAQRDRGSKGIGAHHQRRQQVAVAPIPGQVRARGGVPVPVVALGGGTSPARAIPPESRA